MKQLCFPQLENRTKPYGYRITLQLFSPCVINGQHSDTSGIRSGITFVSRNVISLLAVSNVNNPFGLVGLPYVMWSAHFFVTNIQMAKIRTWNGPTVHVCCFMLARASTKTFVSRVRKTAKKIFVSRKIR
jgi:hypothetical protein